MPETQNDLLKKEIDGMLLRKQSLLASLQDDVSTFEQEKETVSTKIGSAVYAAYKEGTDASKDILDPLFGQMDELEKNIDQKTSKMAEIKARYDEEIEILSKSLNQAVKTEQQSPEPIPGPIQFVSDVVSNVASFCSECGAKYMPGDDLFCENCGFKLEE